MTSVDIEVLGKRDRKIKTMKSKFSVVKDLLIPIFVLAGMTGIYVLLLMGAYSIPESRVTENREIARAIIMEEGDYPNYIFDQDGAILDNYTDTIMLNTTEKYEGMSNLFNALMVQGYARYWHGYVTILRPLLAFTNLFTIRRLASILQLTLFLITLLLLQKRFSYKVTIPFGITWIACYSFAVSASFQYFTCYFWMYVGVIIMTLVYQKNTNRRFLIYFFMLIGSLVNFFDLLTFPLATLAMPLIIMVLVDLYEKEEKTLYTFFKIVLYSVIWAASYALTWVSKWLLTKYILRSNILANVQEQAKYRMVGGDDFQIDRLTVITYNIKTPMFLSAFLTSVIPLILLIILVLIQKRFKEALRMWPFLTIGIMPYIWYEFMCNHSMRHRFFVYRAQMGTLFVILMLFTFMLANFSPFWKKNK